jgi:ATP/ADP translocase
MSDEKKESKPALGGVGLIVTVAVFIAGAFVLTPVLRSATFFELEQLPPVAYFIAAVLLFTVAVYFGRFVEFFLRAFGKGWREGKAK